MSPQVASLFKELGICESKIAHRRLQLQPEASKLIEVFEDKRAYKLSPKAATAWDAMKDAAGETGVSLRLVSAFRSVAYQGELIRRKLSRGEKIDSILRVNAAPGYSEHHTGNAIDVTVNGCPQLTEEFEQTQAFRWLTNHASCYGFQLSYPRDNPYGYKYEPWHWCFHPNFSGR
ncbi:MAG: Putative carboxypeptidase YodJ [Candidatus Moanabacter tarae]|uniref:Carboxypeptidase YodJ n=1 Tax=Candidatus Moanibacter tarae TaxID=2200854 RepID=A0A2Z4AN20_9BACT|nr:MAG: Putative carboxypeptidase YodJ [Candidatus Moanabacter tarae]|tara:strand:+ start:17654 stop:18178 length:525 start_codon:yes stop_codon:yes gene_type:complete